MPHHVVQRGDNRQDVFLADDERKGDARMLRSSTQRGWPLATDSVGGEIRAALGATGSATSNRPAEEEIRETSEKNESEKRT